MPAIEFETRTLTTPKFRGYYVQLITARAIGTGKPKFSILMPFSKADAVERAFVATCFSEVKRAAAAVGMQGTLAEMGANFPIKDGAVGKDETTKNHYLVRAAANADHRPGVVENKRDPATGKPRILPLTPEEIYSGAYYVAQINVFPWSYFDPQTKFTKKGVSIGLQAVMRVAHGERIGGGVNAAEAFDSSDMISAPSAADSVDMLMQGLMGGGAAAGDMPPF